MTKASRVLLIVGGGVAAYKALELVRLLAKAGVSSEAILTAAGAEFVTPLSLSALTGAPVRSALFDLTDEAKMGHIELSRSADLIVVAPATADLMAKAAAGIAGDLATTTLLATDKPVLMAPAMNVKMWEHPATQSNLARLKADGVAFVGPDDGEMACGEYGPGRMAEPAAIRDAVLALLHPTTKPLNGRRALVTAGPTREPIDPVRYLTNRSSGTQGYAIAAALAALGAEVTLVSGPTALAAPAGVTRVEVETAEEMLAACQAAQKAGGAADIAVMTAAVSDWTPEAVSKGKIKKGSGEPRPLKLRKTPDILATLAAKGRARPRLVIGFAAETEGLETHAAQKLKSKGCDLIVGNDVTEDGVMGGAENRVTLFTAAGAEAWPRMSKTDVAKRLAERIAAQLGDL